MCYIIAMKKIIIASNNKDKIAEIAAMLKGRFEVLSMREAGLNIDIDETGTTFDENAVIKAKVCFAHTGLPCLADDSGLCVDTLGGAPGVYSAEYAARYLESLGDNSLETIGHYSQDMSDANVDLVLRNLKGITDRCAKFVCVMAYYDGKNAILGHGETHGEILLAREGNGGFGYDPIFFSYETGKSFGSTASADKNAVSHRRRALEDLVSKI